MQFVPVVGRVGETSSIPSGMAYIGGALQELRRALETTLLQRRDYVPEWKVLPSAKPMYLLTNLPDRARSHLHTAPFTVEKRRLRVEVSPSGGGKNSVGRWKKLRRAVEKTPSGGGIFYVVGQNNLGPKCC
jgi:hypothetical protein